MLPPFVSITDFIIVSTILLCIGLCGMFLNKRNILLLLMSLELSLLAISINFVAFSVYLKDLTGQIFAIFILTLAGAEAAIGLAILILYRKNKGNINIDQVPNIKG